MFVDVEETYRRYRIRELTVDFRFNVSDEERRRNTGIDDDHNDTYAVMFRRFVNTLDGYFRIRTLHMTRANFWRHPRHLLEDEGEDIPANGFDPSLLLEDKYLVKFFGEVLPNHLSLRKVTISKSRIQPQYWKLFTENFLSSGFRLMLLSLESTLLTMESCQLLKRMLQRKVTLFQLKLEDCGLGADEWRVVSEGISDNTRLHTVTLVERNVTVVTGTLLPLLQEPSFVNHLEVRAAGWTSEAFEEFVMALRTNTVLCDLTLHCNRRREIPNSRLVEGLLESYSFALETVVLRPCRDPALLLRVNKLLERNKRARALGKPRYRHQVDQFYQFPSRAVWPRVLEGWNQFPTLLYRFVRKGNLEAFANQVQQEVVKAAAADAQHGASKVQPVVEMEPSPAEAHPTVQHAPSQVLPVAEIQTATQGANKKRRHQLISN
jgi:hypothetical protein